MDRYNLIYIFADQWRRDICSVYNNTQAITPNMMEMAKDGVVFENAVSTCPLCSPHRASLLTGKHPLNTGIFTNCKTGSDIRLKDDEICAGDILKDNGYKTAYIGKWHLDEPELNHSENPVSGAQRWDAYTPEGIRRHGFDYWYAYNAWDEHMRPHYWKNTPEKIFHEGWSVEHETDVAINYIDNLDKKDNFAMFISWNPPHSPYDQVPQKYLDMYDENKLMLKENVKFPNIKHHTYEEDYMPEEKLRLTTAQYYAAVSGLDENLGRIIKYLKDNNLYENTLLVISSDHGDMLGSHGLIGKHVWFEESVGIPLIMCGANLPKDKRLNTVIGSPDMLPTILNLISCKTNVSFEGEDVSNAIQEDDLHKEKACFLAACPGREVFLKDFAKANKNPENFGWRAIRTRQYMYVIDVGYDIKPKLQRILYNLKQDELQQNPQLIQSASENNIAHELELKLIKWIKEQNDGFITHLENAM